MTDVREDYDIVQDAHEDLCHGKAWPLPRFTPHKPIKDHYEIVVVGAGPAGLFLALQLYRLGLDDESLLCVDGKAHATSIGHADGILGRTMEILATVDLVDEVNRRGRKFNTAVAWQKTSEGTLECIRRAPFDIWAPTRFATLRAIHQARLERKMLQDMSSYSRRRVQYSTKVIQARIDEFNPEHPLIVTLEENGQTREVRTKYLVGAEGAHSKVRRDMGIPMEGDVTDRVWGVIEYVPESDFPDIRRTNTLNHEDSRLAGMIIPREQLSNGDWLARFYIDMTDVRLANGTEAGTQQNDTRKSKVEFTRDQIIDNFNTWIQPHYVRPKKGTAPYWWATYSIGQRLAKQYIVEDSQAHPRVFLVGDACHTHTPSQGQGLNISMGDSYNLAWKLVTALFGLCPDPQTLLRTYETERRPWAERVVFFDKRWNQGHMSLEDKFREMSEQVTNTGVDYAPSLIIAKHNDAIDFMDRELASGVLKVGRRLLNVKLLRFVDEDVRDIHDDLPMNGKHRVVVLADHDFLGSRSIKAVEALCVLAQTFPENIVEVIILQQDMEPKFAWTDLPPVVKQAAEMRLYSADQDVYKTYGVDPAAGAVVLVRPDHHVAMTTGLDDFEDIGRFLKQILIQRHAN